MSVGDVHWVEFGSGAGRAQAGRRPAVVVQSEAACTALPTTLVIPLTSQQDALRFPGTVLIDPTPDNGLPRISVALVFQLTVVDWRFVSSKIGRVSNDVLKQLWLALDELTERPVTPVEANDGSIGV